MNARPNHHNEPTEVATYAPSSAHAEGSTGIPYGVVGDKYRLIRRIGTGGMGDVYLAEHMVIGKQVAVKFLRRELASDPTHAARFLQEARAASSIRHENVVDITDFGRTPDEQPFFVMELLEGESLRDLLSREGRLPWDRARDIILQVLDGLTAAHEKNVIHRDIKPENCFCSTRPGRKTHVKLLDFSIAKLTGVEAASLTSTGAPIGTIYYMSPEQARGEKDIDIRTDVYSTGVMLYEMLSGDIPFNAENFYGVLYKIIHENAPSADMVDNDAELRQNVQSLLHRALAKDRSERFSSAFEFRQAIEAVRAKDANALGHATTMFASPSPPVAIAPANVAETQWSWIKIGAAIGAVVLSGTFLANRAHIQENVAPSITPQLEIHENSEQSEPVKPTPLPVDPPETGAKTVGAVVVSPSAPDPPTKEQDTAIKAEKAPPATPERRSDSQINRGLRGVGKKVEACQKYALGDTVKIGFVIAPDGRVTSSDADGLHRTSPLGTCVAKAILEAKFGPATKEQSVTKSYTF